MGFARILRDLGLIFKMFYIVPDTIVYGTAVILIVSALSFAGIFLFCRDFVVKRLTAALTGKNLVEVVDVDGRSEYGVYKKRAGVLIGKEAEYIISHGSAIRTRDGDKYFVSKPLALTITPAVIEAVTNLMRDGGYNSFSEALYAYQKLDHPQDWEETIGKTVELDPVKNKKQIDLFYNEFDRRVKEKIMRQEIDFTRDLSVLYNWTAQPLDAYSNRNLVEQEVLEAEKMAKHGTIPMERVFQYMVVFAIVGVIGGVMYIMVMNGTAGGAGVQAVAQTAANVTQSVTQNVTQNISG
jgi:hypothetical protein